MAMDNDVAAHDDSAATHDGGAATHTEATTSESADTTLKEYIYRCIVPQYAAFDKAHQADHAHAVIDRSAQLARHYDLNAAMVLTVAAYHDLGLCEGRERHHIVSGEILRADTTLQRWFSQEQIEIMSQAVEDHRASNDHAPRTIYGKIVAEADRLIIPEVTLRRTVQYGLSHYPELTREQHFARFCGHLHEKYAEGGYLKLWIPHSDNALRLAELRAIIANEQLLTATFDTIYAEECRLYSAGSLSESSSAR